MNVPFLWWIGRSTRNRVRRQLRQLRNVRYLVAFLFGVLYLAFMFWGWVADDGMRGELTGRHLAVARHVLPLFLALLAAWWWLWGGHRSALQFTPAETHLLLPAPVSRHALIRFKIMQAQVPILFSASLVTLFTRGSPLPWPLRVLTMWLVFATLHLHQVAASLVHAAAEEHGRHGLRRNRIAVAVFAVAFVVVIVALGRALGALRGATSLPQALEAAAAVLAATGPRIVLAPFRLLVAPVVAPSFSEWLLPAAGVGVLLVAHYLWLQRSNTAFEEAASAEGARRAELVASVRAGRGARLFAASGRKRRIRAAWLPLTPGGRPEYAIFWKNILFVQRLLRPRTLLAVAVFVGIMLLLNTVTAGSRTGLLHALTLVLFMFTGLVTVLGALLFRNDLRMDLAFLDQIRTYPLRGRAVVAAGVAAAATCMTAMQLCLLVPTLVLAASGGMLRPVPAFGVFLVALLVLPVLNALAALIQNAIALLFPAWTRIGEGGSGGMETMGQNMLNVIGSLLLLVFAALPPLLLGIVVGAPLSLQFGALAVVPAAAAALAGIGGEVFLATRWLGRMFDTMDPVQADLLR